jgi:hypothetical protein
MSFITIQLGGIGRGYNSQHIDYTQVNWSFTVLITYKPYIAFF